MPKTLLLFLFLVPSFLFASSDESIISLSSAPAEATTYNFKYSPKKTFKINMKVNLATTIQFPESSNISYFLLGNDKDFHFLVTPGGKNKNVGIL